MSKVRGLIGWALMVVAVVRDQIAYYAWVVGHEIRWNYWGFRYVLSGYVPVLTKTMEHEMARLFEDLNDDVGGQLVELRAQVRELESDLDALWHRHEDSVFGVPV